MSETMRVVPAPGLPVIDPATGKALPAEGAEVPRNTYWERRLLDRDVTRAEPAAAAPKAAAKKEK